jgi:hypothetical protein
MVFMISPTSARVSSPPPSTTMTSPGPTSSSARWIARLSPGARAHGEGGSDQPAAAMERPQAHRPRQPGEIVADDRGRRVPERPRSGQDAGFGTLVMAVVMLIKTVSLAFGPDFLCRFARRRSGSPPCATSRDELMARRHGMAQHHEVLRCGKTNSIPQEQL